MIAVLRRRRGHGEKYREKSPPPLKSAIFKNLSASTRAKERGAQGVDATDPHECNCFNEQRLGNRVFFREQIDYCRVITRPMINQVATKPAVFASRQKMVVSVRMLQESPIQIIGRTASADMRSWRPLAEGNGELFTTRGRLFLNRPRVRPTQAGIT